MVVNPNPPGVGSWFTPTGGWTPQTSYAGSPYGSQPGGVTPSTGTTGTRPRFYATQNGPVTLPSDWSDQDAQQWVQAYDQYIARLTQQWKQTSGLQKRQIEAQIEDARKARENQMAIARLQDRTSRYGTDQQVEQQIADRQQRAREFQASHGLELAKTYAQYASSPDDLFQLQDLKTAVGAASSGGYQTDLAAQSSGPRRKTMNDFAVLSNYGPGGGTGGGSGQQSGGGAGSQQDMRLKAMKAVSEAMPPSQTQGHDQQDYAAIDAIKALYFSGRPGEVERLDPIQQREAMGGLRRAGYNADQVVAQRRRSLPGQGDSRAA